MASDTGTTESSQLDAGVTAPAEEIRIKRRRVRVRRKQEKFPRPLRIALLLGLPILLWTGIYFIGRALL